MTAWVFRLLLLLALGPVSLAQAATEAPRYQFSPPDFDGIGKRLKQPERPDHIWPLAQLHQPDDPAFSQGKIGHRNQQRHNHGKDLRHNPEHAALA